jgi:hypothetical protein
LAVAVGLVGGFVGLELSILRLRIQKSGLLLL